ncbi:VOC family protein [Agromyces italicus]|uniref:VOC family protein n=1 Tax=Agromyces italicus TaxID=279572 RepID=UPI0003B7159E|nr:hypothetical protein [Agromyces italicus]
MNDPANIIRVYDRAYVHPEHLSAFLRATMHFYNARPTIRFEMPDQGMSVIGLESDTANFSVVSAAEEHLAPLYATGQTILVASIDRALEDVRAAGGSVVQVKTPVPPGFQARGRLPGGNVIEFAQWDHAEPYRNPDLSDLGIG